MIKATSLPSLKKPAGINLFKIKQYAQHLQGRKLYILDNWKERLASLGLKEGCDWLQLEPGEIISNSHRVKAYRVPLEDGNEVYFKTYSFHGQLTDYFMRPSKCAIEVNSYQILKDLGIPTTEPLAFGEDRVGGMLKSCFIVTLGIGETQSLDEFAYNVWYHLPPAEKKKAFEQIFEETIRYTQIAHDANFFHYDLKWRNILVKKEGEDYKTIWIDCPRGRRNQLRSNRGRMVDLSCLARLALSYLSRTQRYRFLKRYMGSKADRTAVRNMWNLVTNHLSRRPPDPIKFPDK